MSRGIVQSENDGQISAWIATDSLLNNKKMRYGYEKNTIIKHRN